MIIRLLILFVMFTSLNAEEGSWYDGIHPKIEAGMHISNFDGTQTAVSNIDTSFKDDFGYKDTASSFFGIEINLDYDYVPNIEINYFNVKQNRDADFSEPIEVVNFDFNGSVTTQIEYRVINVVLAYDIKQKGQRVNIFGWKIYPGDIKYAIGVNLKNIDWYFQIIQRKDPNAEFKFIRVQSSVPSPYLGFKYYYYNLIAYANISALSFGEAKTTNYQVGIDYKVIKDLYLSVSYMYEDFEATEKEDSINFKTSGNKFSFKYLF